MNNAENDFLAPVREKSRTRARCVREACLPRTWTVNSAGFYLDNFNLYHLIPTLQSITRCIKTATKSHLTTHKIPDLSILKKNLLFQKVFFFIP